LAKRYDKIIWEGGLRVSELPGGLDHALNRYALDNSREYGRWAAVGELQKTIRRAVAKAGSEIINAQMAYSTTTCARCEPSDKLIIRCPRGHEFDKDVNAATNLLAESQIKVRKKSDPLRVSRILRSVIVPYTD
jgi:hypothetical protein